MSNWNETTSKLQDAEPRWPAFVAVLTVGGLYTALPEVLTMGPRWLFPSIVLVLLIPNIVSHHTGRRRLNTLLGFLGDGALTTGLIISLILLIAALPTHKQTPVALLFSAASLWATNIVVFALMVLAIGRRRAEPARQSSGSSRRRFLVPADDYE